MIKSLSASLKPGIDKKACEVVKSDGCTGFKAILFVGHECVYTHHMFDLCNFVCGYVSDKYDIDEVELLHKVSLSCMRLLSFK